MACGWNRRVTGLRLEIDIIPGNPLLRTTTVNQLLETRCAVEHAVSVVVARGRRVPGTRPRVRSRYDSSFEKADAWN